MKAYAFVPYGQGFYFYQRRIKMSKGRFGIHGGQFVPETLMNAVGEFEEAYDRYKDDPAFVAELDTLLR